jgi:TRAP-type uncharacterized transport system fused permease subunit
MIRLGYPRHFAGAVEAASVDRRARSRRRSWAPAAFLMIEFLNLPYQTIIIAAIVPAFMHFYGVFMQVHFEAKRTGLRGLTPDELPDVRKQLAANWPTLIPLVLLIAIIVTGSTPYLAAFTGISSAVLVGFFTTRGRTTLAQWVALAVGHALLLALITGKFGEYNVYAFLVCCRSSGWCTDRSRRNPGSPGRTSSRPSRPAPNTRWRSAPRPRRSAS